MLPKDVNILFDALSTPRINSYKNYFSTQLSNEQIHGCYQWNESVSLSFFKLTTLLELVMRNRMHAALSHYYFQHQKQQVQNFGGNPYNWNLAATTTIGSANSCNWYESGVLSPKSLSKVHSKTHHQRNKTPWSQNKRPSADDVVSSLTFGFWSSLIDKNPNIDWPNLLGDIFPKHRATASQQWGNTNQQKRVGYRLQLVRDIRNRIAHHEPIWKLPKLLDEKPPAQPNLKRQTLLPPTSSPSESISRLRSIYSKHTELLRWMSQEIYNDFRLSTVHSNFLWLCSTEGLDAHINRSQKLPNSVLPSRFKREFELYFKTKRNTVFAQSGA